MRRRLMNSMVKLKNIKKNNQIIECDILPEDSEEYGHIVVDLSSHKLISYSLPKEYEWCKKHVFHAHHKLISLSKSNELLTNAIVVWY